MCDMNRCPSEADSCSVGDDGPAAMLDILDEFQRLYRERIARLNRDLTSPTYSKVMTASRRSPVSYSKVPDYGSFPPLPIYYSKLLGQTMAASRPSPSPIARYQIIAASHPPPHLL